MSSLKKEEKIRYHMVAPAIGVDASWTIHRAINHMYEKKIKSILVKEGADYVGIVTESDLIFKVLLGDLDRNKDKVSCIMSPDILSMDLDKTLGEAVEFMREQKIKHLAVTEKGRIVGMLSVKDLIAYMAK